LPEEKFLAEKKYDGRILKQSLKSAEKILEKQIDELNALNIFPVPDGDTGINMFLTLQAATAALADIHSRSAAEISAKAARGALIGARGNSGVILSQILRGIAKGMEMKERFSAFDFAQAIQHASDTAYKGIAKPVEGTILTVIREASEAAMQQAKRGANLRQTIAAMASNAYETVRRTPDLLPVLKEAGVVDAGGKGLLYIFMGMNDVASGHVDQQVSTRKKSRQGKSIAIEESYGFALQFLIEGDNLPIEEIKDKIGKIADLAQVVGDEHLLRVHVHTHDTQTILYYAAAKGTLKNINVESMDEQVKRFKSSGNTKPDSTKQP
jgi:DAK2 domain fusion protein YloV